MIKVLYFCFPNWEFIEKIYDNRQKNNRAKRIKKYIEQAEKKKNKIPPYLKDNNFETELNYKLWTTKGARFKASERNHSLNKLSSKAIGYLSAYLIIVGVLNIYEITIFGIQFTDKEIGFITTAISVLILLFSQLESSEGFLLKAERYHNCALDLSELYNRLRTIKNEKSTVKELEIKNITDGYQALLKKYDNHLPIDYTMFLITKCDYFEISNYQKRKYIVMNYLQTRFVYHLLIYSPIPLIIALLVNKYFSDS